MAHLPPPKKAPTEKLTQQKSSIKHGERKENKPKRFSAIGRWIPYLIRGSAALKIDYKSCFQTILPFMPWILLHGLVVYYCSSSLTVFAILQSL